MWSPSFEKSLSDEKRYLHFVQPSSQSATGVVRDFDLSSYFWTLPTNILIYPHLSGTLGAKQLVVVIMHTIFSSPNSLIFFSTSEISVLNSSPSRTFSIITGINPKNIEVQKNYLMFNFSRKNKPIQWRTLREGGRHCPPPPPPPPNNF